jgi:hypothetical protein
MGTSEVTCDTEEHTFKMANIQMLTHEAADNIHASAWVGCVQHAEKLQENDFRRENVRENMLKWSL